MRADKQARRHLSPPIVIAGSFLLLIIFGTLLLKLPVATTHPITWTDALFTASSATTVTGLSVFDIASTLTLFGLIVLLVLIQFGGIGLMTFAVAILVLFGKRIGMQSRMYIQESFNESGIGGMVKLVRQIVSFALITEGIAVVLLSIYWIPTFGWRNGIYYSIFHVISAFNNAGFSLFPDNLIRFTGDPVVLLILSSLFIIGGIGFVVMLDLFANKPVRKWSLHTKIMIIGTLVLNGVATLTLLLLEYHNVQTIGDFPFVKKYSFPISKPLHRGLLDLTLCQLVKWKTLLCYLRCF